jgi:extradiol dioxygenase family protein
VPAAAGSRSRPALRQFAQRVRTFVDDFIIEPYVRFEGLPGEQHTMFFADPSGNALEFKAFADIEAELFATTREAQA